MSSSCRRAAAIVLLLVVCVACGRKGPPQPPIVRTADPTRDLTVVQRELRAELEWSYPQMTTAGGVLPDIEKIEVMRVELPKAQEPPGDSDRDRQAQRNLFEARAVVIGVLEGEGLAAATTGAMLRFTDDVSGFVPAPEVETDAGNVYWYAVRTVCCGRRVSDLSNIARCVPDVPPETPEGLEITPEQDGLHLHWDENPEHKVQVERSSDGESFTVVTPAPQAEGLWVDRGAMQEQRWFYRLRGVVEDTAGNILRVGFAGPVVEADYPDRYAPEAPAELVCLPEGAQVRLRWRASPDADTFVVERRAGSGAPVLLADDVKSPHFLDQKAPAVGATYLVSAADSAGNRSQPVTCQTAAGGSR